MCLADCYSMRFTTLSNYHLIDWLMMQCLFVYLKNWFYVLLQQFDMENWCIWTRIDYHPCITSKRTNSMWWSKISGVSSICLQISGVSEEKFTWLLVAKLGLKANSNCSNSISFLLDENDIFDIILKNVSNPWLLGSIL